MATTTNQLYQTNILSAAGSAEVLGRGSNDYTTKWSYTTVASELGGWDKYSNFPTAVRTGNFVWVLYEIYGSNHRAVWILADVVPDPSVDRQFGNNIAYPEIPDHVKYQFDFTSLNAAAYKASADVINTSTYDISVDGTPRYAFTVTGHKTTANDGENGNTQSHFSTSRLYKEIVYNGNSGGGFVTTDTAHVPRLHGHGSAQYLLQGTVSENNASVFDVPGNNFVYNLWPPFATKAQFETLYGTEAAWIHSTASTAHHMLFAQPATQTNRTIVYSGDDPTISYPFAALPTFTSNTKFKDIPGDTNGDGIDNTPSFEAALAGYAVASVIKCDGFPEDLIPGLDMEAINKKLNDAKAGIESAISSTGLLDLEKKLEGLKADIIDKFPKATEVLNFVEALVDLDLNNLAKDAVDKLKEEWKFIDNIDEFVDGIIDDIANFDICSTIGLKGKTAADGSLVNKPASPSIPDKPIEEPTQSSYVPEQSKETAQTAPAAAVGITPKDLEDANKEFGDKWKQLSEDKQFSWGKDLKGYDGENPSFDPAPDVIESDIEGVIFNPTTGPVDIGEVLQSGQYNDSDSVSQIPTQDGIPLPPTLGGTPPGPTVTDIVGPVTLPPIVDGITDERFLPPAIIPLPPTLGGSPDALPELKPGKKVENQPVFKSGAEWEKRLREIKNTEIYQEYQRLLNEKENVIDNTSTTARKKLLQDLSEVLIPVYNYRYFKSRLNFFRKKLNDSMLVDGKRGDYFPTTDYEIADKWDLGEFDVAEVGSPLGFEGVLDGVPVAVMTQENYDALAKVDAEFVAALKKYFFTEEGVRLQQKIMAGQNPPFDEDIQNKLLDALSPEDSEGDPANDNIQPIEEYDPSSKKQNSDELPQGGPGNPPGMLPAIEDVDVSLSSSTTTTSTPTSSSSAAPSAGGNRVTLKNQFAKRNGSVQPRLLSILEKSAEELDYTVEIFSGGQVPVSKGGRSGVNRVGTSKRHDDGYAVDIYTYNKQGRKLRVQANANHRDTLAVKEWVKVLLKNGITSVGADSDYMNGDLHLDIAASAGLAPKACWGKGPLGNRRIYAPSWLTSTFDSNVT